MVSSVGNRVVKMYLYIDRQSGGDVRRAACGGSAHVNKVTPGLCANKVTHRSEYATGIWMFSLCKNYSPTMVEEVLSAASTSCGAHHYQDTTEEERGRGDNLRKRRPNEHIDQIIPNGIIISL